MDNTQTHDKVLDAKSLVVDALKESKYLVMYVLKEVQLTQTDLALSNEIMLALDDLRNSINKYNFR